MKNEIGSKGKKLCLPSRKILRFLIPREKNICTKTFP
jgi:hypothetical protein